MAYLYRQKLKISDLVNLPTKANRIVIYEPEDYLGALYGHYLAYHDFDVRHCANLLELKETVSGFFPDILVFSADQGGFKLHLQSLTQDFPQLKVVTTAYNWTHQEIADLMSLGVLSHINRRFSRPTDLAMLDNTFIN